MSQPIAATSPLSLVFLLHIAFEIPVAIQGVWSPSSLPFLDLNNTSLVMLKLYAALVLATCIVSFLCFSLPEYLPGKRALAIGLCIYHSISSTILFQSPRFIPHTFGAVFEHYKVTPEVVWGLVHGFLSLGMVVWWQGTLHMSSLMRKTQ